MPYSKVLRYKYIVDAVKTLLVAADEDKLRCDNDEFCQV